MRTTHMSCATLLVLTGVSLAGEITFHDPAVFTEESVHTVAPLSVTDVDGDSVPDLIVAGGATGLEYRRGLGSGAFAPPQTIADWRDTRGVFVADLDGDGDVDATRFGIASIARNDGDGVFTVVAGATVADLGTARLIDLGADGLPDVLDLATSGGELRLYRNRGDLVFDAVEILELPELGLDRDVAEFAVADLDGDGRDDLIVGSHEPELAVLRQTVDGSFEIRQTAIQVQHTVGAFGFHTGDVDGDGDLDVLHFGHVFVNAGDGSIETHHDARLPLSWYQGFSSHVALTDLDNDQLADLLYIDSERRLQVVPGDEGALTGESFPSERAPIDLGLGEASNFHPLVVGDADPDGRSDVVVGSVRTGQLIVLRQSGGPPPRAEGLTPDVVEEAGTVEMRLTGTGFAESTAVSIPGAADLTPTSTPLSDEIRFLADFRTGVGGGPRTLEVRNSDGQIDQRDLELRSLRLNLRKGRLLATIEPARDELRLRGRIAPTTLSPTAARGLASALRRDGLELALGDTEAALRIAIGPDDDRWEERRRGRVLVWRTGTEEFPRVRLRLDTRSRRFRLTVSHYDHPDETPEAAALTLESGVDRGARTTTWRPKGRRGKLRLER